MEFVFAIYVHGIPFFSKTNLSKLSIYLIQLILDDRGNHGHSHLCVYVIKTKLKSQESVGFIDDRGSEHVQQTFFFLVIYAKHCFIPVK